LSCAPTSVHLHKLQACRRTAAFGAASPASRKVRDLRALPQIQGWHIDCLNCSQSMTTAVWIAEASVGRVQGQVQKSDDLAEASGAVVGATPTKLVHLCF